MQIQPVLYNNQKNHQILSSNNKHINFEGGLRFRSSSQVRGLKYTTERIADKLNLRIRVVRDLTSTASEKQVAFLETLSNVFNARNFNAKNPENPQTVLDIYHMFPKPKKAHFYAVSNFKGSIEHIKSLLSLAKTEENLSLADNLQKHIYRGEEVPIDTLKAMLSSSNKESYINDFEAYKSYLLINKDDESAIKELDRLIKNGSYNREKYDKKLDAENFFNNGIFRLYLFEHKDIIEKYYSKEGSIYLNKFFNNYAAYRNISQVDMQDILAIFKTTNHKNLDMRLSILQNTQNKFQDDAQYTVAEIKTIKNLYAELDKNESLRQAIQAIFNENVTFGSVQELAEVFEVVPPKMALVFHENIANILKKTIQGQERKTALEQQVLNPFFDTPASSAQKKSMIKYGFASNESKVSKWIATLKNKFNVYKYNKAEKDEVLTGIVVQKSAVKQAKSAPTPEKTAVVEPKLLEDKTLNGLKLANKPKESPLIRKLAIISDVKGLITERLGVKTLQNQEEIYTKNATKMRLKLLPEIFNSIRESAKNSRAKGLRPKSDNRDAVQLYQKIKGNNRKLIRYMLLKQDNTGNRMFEVKDITSFINQVETEIAKRKKQSPDFKAKQARELYNEIFDDYVEMLGKLKTSKKKN